MRRKQMSKGAMIKELGIGKWNGNPQFRGAHVGTICSAAFAISSR
jgi:hypothetical protein